MATVFECRCQYCGKTEIIESEDPIPVEINKFLKKYGWIISGGVYVCKICAPKVLGMVI